MCGEPKTRACPAEPQKTAQPPATGAGVAAGTKEEGVLARTRAARPDTVDAERAGTIRPPDSGSGGRQSAAALPASEEGAPMAPSSPPASASLGGDDSEAQDKPEEEEQSASPSPEAAGASRYGRERGHRLEHGQGRDRTGLVRLNARRRRWGHASARGDVEASREESNDDGSNDESNVSRGGADKIIRRKSKRRKSIRRKSIRRKR